MDLFGRSNKTCKCGTVSHCSLILSHQCARIKKRNTNQMFFSFLPSFMKQSYSYASKSDKYNAWEMKGKIFCCWDEK